MVYTISKRLPRIVRYESSDREGSLTYRTVVDWFSTRAYMRAHLGGGATPKGFYPSFIIDPRRFCFSRAMETGEMELNGMEWDAHDDVEN